MHIGYVLALYIWIKIRNIHEHNDGLAAAEGARVMYITFYQMYMYKNLFKVYYRHLPSVYCKAFPNVHYRTSPDVHYENYQIYHLIQMMMMVQTQTVRNHCNHN